MRYTLILLPLIAFAQDPVDPRDGAAVTYDPSRRNSARFWADEIQKADGSAVYGRIAWTGDGATVATPAGEVKVDWADIKKVRQMLPREDAGFTKFSNERRKELERRKKTLHDDEAARAELAGWCRAWGLDDEARKFAKTAVVDKKAYAEMLKKTDRKDTNAMLGLMKYCVDNNLKSEKWDAALYLLRRDHGQKDAIAALREDVAWRVPRHPAFLSPIVGLFLLRQTGGWQDAGVRHEDRISMQFATDFVMVDEKGAEFKTDGKALDDYFGWDQPVRAAAAGRVYAVRNDFADHPPGEAGDLKDANMVTLVHSGGECTLYGHFKQGSISVKVNDWVAAGQEIGRIGNSGMSARPHLHFGMVLPDLSTLDPADKVVDAVLVGAPAPLKAFTLKRVGDKALDIPFENAFPAEDWTIELRAD